MRTRFLGFWLVVALLGVAGCGGDNGGDLGAADAVDARGDEPVADTEGDAAPGDLRVGDGQVADDTASDEVGGDFSTCAYSGRVVDDGGAPIEKVAIVICGEDVSKCVKGTSKADGTWRVSGTARTALGAKVLGGPSGHTSVSLPLAPCAHPDTDVGDVVLLAPDAGDDYDGVTGDWVQVHPHLALQLPPGVQTQMYETQFVAQAAEADASALHSLLTAQIEPLTAFALVPYDAETPAPVPFRVTLPVASTLVGVYVLDYLTGAFQFVEDVPVDADGVATSTDGGGLSQLTWVAFVAR